MRNYFHESSAIPAGTGFFARTLSIAVNNLFERIGLVMYASMPADSYRSRSSFIACAVNATMRTSFPVDASRLRIAAVASKPFTSGI
jgi:hypothetical protein